MKIESFAYRAASKALELLQRKFHYKIPDNVFREVCETVRNETASLMDDGTPSGKNRQD